MPAWAIDDQQRALIARKALFHYTSPSSVNNIIANAPTGKDKQQVSLRAFQGWSFNPLKLIRDVTIWDADFSSENYGQYLYFFLGPARQTERWLLRQQGLTASIEVAGEDLIKLSRGRIFLRKSDRAVIVRGGYEGPAIVDRGG